MIATAPLIISMYGIGAAVLWGSADYLGANASKRNNPNAATLGVSALGTLLFTIIFLFNHGSVHWNLVGILYSVAAGISLELGLLVFYRGLDAGPVNLVSPISSAYPLVSLLIILLIFGGSLKPLEIVGIVIVVIGIAIASGILNTNKSERRLSKGIIYALLTVVIWGIAYALVGKSVASLGWQKATLVNFYAGLAILPIALTIIVGKQFWKGINRNIVKDKYIITAAITQSLGGVVFNIGVSHTTSSAVITAISASYPALTIFLALKGLKEKAKTVSLIGAFTTIIGIVVLSV
jgi:drug/metabolite transporter (DMT)-like permease